MESTALRAYVRRCRAVTDASPPETVAETCRWLVEPLLASLGWSPEPADPAADVEYVCSVEGVPALLVAVEAYPDPLDAKRSDRLRAAMVRSAVDRAIYTNGADLALFPGPGGEPTALTVDGLADHVDALEPFEKGRARRRLEANPDLRVARLLADDREELATEVAAALVDRAGEGHSRELRLAADRFLDRLVAALAGSPDDGGTPGGELPEDSGDPSDGSGEPSGDSGGSSDGLRECSGNSGEPSGDSGEPTPADSPEPDRPADDPDGERPREPTGRSDGEYVVRFFADRGSIGAVGHSDSGEATVQAAEFLLERGLSGVSPPWPDDGPILLESPEAGDAPRELSNGLVLDVGRDATERGRRVVALAERAGLRAMLTGDWA